MGFELTSVCEKHRIQKRILKKKMMIESRCSGTEGFEPPNSGTKTRCLTTWPRPT